MFPSILVWIKFTQSIVWRAVVAQKEQKKQDTICRLLFFNWKHLKYFWLKEKPHKSFV